MKNKKKNKNLIIVLLFITLAVGVFSLIQFLLGNYKRGGQGQGGLNPTPTPAEIRLPAHTQPPLTPDNKVDYASPRVQKAVEAKKELLAKLPIYIEGFKTSVDLATTINIYQIPQDADYLIHIDIYGINYQNQESDEGKNPEATAFKESFLEVKSVLRQSGVDIEDIYFVFGGPEYIQQTGELWIKHFGLL